MKGREVLMRIYNGAPKWLKPDVGGPIRPANQAEWQVVRSYLLIRAAIGVIGLCLPIGLLLGSAILAPNEGFLRDSLSAYYYSAVRDLFVGVLFATGIFLVTYKILEEGLDNTLSIVAGVAIMGVALFPTGRPRGLSVSLTGLQERLSESMTSAVHLTCATIFIGCLAVLCVCFGMREGKRDRASRKKREDYQAILPPLFWKWFHWSCSGIIVLAVIFVFATKWSGWFSDHSLLYGEVVALVAFGVSWLTKGAELHVLIRNAPAAPAAKPQGAATPA